MPAADLVPTFIKVKVRPMLQVTRSNCNRRATFLKLFFLVPYFRSVCWVRSFRKPSCLWQSLTTASLINLKEFETMLLATNQIFLQPNHEYKGSPHKLWLWSSPEWPKAKQNQSAYGKMNLTSPNLHTDCSWLALSNSTAPCPFCPFTLKDPTEYSKCVWHIKGNQ